MAKGKKVGGKLKISELAYAVMNELNDYKDYVGLTVIKEASKQTAEDAVQQLQSLAPVRTGRYKGSFDVMMNEKGTGYIVYSPTDYQLTHLLEHGHALRNGGRTKAMPHWAPTEASLPDNFKKHFKEAL